MGAIKFMLKWVGIVLGLFCVLGIGIVIMSKINMEKERQDDAAMQKLIADKEVVSGMSPDQVREIWGTPDRVTQGIVHGVHVEHWIYAATPPKYDNGRYVGFREGKVVIITAEQPKP